jgi:hypothetical protein
VRDRFEFFVCHSERSEESMATSAQGLRTRGFFAALRTTAFSHLAAESTGWPAPMTKALDPITLRDHPRPSVVGTLRVDPHARDCTDRAFLHRAGMLRRFFALCFAAAGFACVAAADTLHISKPEVHDEIVAAIEGQLAAFRANDIGKAYDYAAAGLRANTPLTAFARMVRQSYPEIWQSTRAEFGLVRDDGAKARLIVHVFSKAGEAAYDYVLFKEAPGWRIGGVLRREARPGETL